MQSEPTLKKNKSGYYEVRWSEKLDNGEWRTRSISARTTDLQEARDFLKGWNLAQRQTTPKADPIFRDLADTYLKAGSSRITTPGQKCNMKWLNQHFGELTAPEIDAKVVADYTDARMTGAIGKSTAKASTVYKELTTLRTVLKYAAKVKLIPLDAVPHVDKPVRGQPRDIWLDEHEEAEFLVLAEQTSLGKPRMSRIHRFVHIALATGARREAIETLRWDHVDLQTGTIDYAKTDGRMTKKRRVAVPISDRLMPVLKQAHAERKNDWVLDSGGDIWPVFDSLIRGTKFEHIRPHDLRRTCATLMARAGVPLWEIAGVLGDSIEVVQRHYLHHAPGHLRSAVNRSIASNGAGSSPLLNSKVNSVEAGAATAANAADPVFTAEMPVQFVGYSIPLECAKAA